MFIFTYRNKQASTAQALPRVKIDFSLVSSSNALAMLSTPVNPAINGNGNEMVHQAVRFTPTRLIKPRIHKVEEEIAFGPACWYCFYALLLYAGSITMAFDNICHILEKSVPIYHVFLSCLLYKGCGISCVDPALVVSFFPFRVGQILLLRHHWWG